MVMISALGMSMFGLDPVEDYGDRLAHGVALLLTIVAFKFVIAGRLPLLSYLTLLDKYVMWSFTFIFGLCAEATAVHYVVDADPDFDETPFIYFFLGLFVFAQGVFAWLACRRASNEFKRMTMSIKESDQTQSNIFKIKDDSVTKGKKGMPHYLQLG